ncbi:OprD family outer membrane porin [Pseudomonas helleri]|uniref:Outer membrane porin, OprD family n=1 Tax=Pseudomonas helleri TaxID=1608996 RepID=A0A6L5HY03_9PSED|nr:OprD family outer membrane porin [Pseudomonas helleri]MQU08163.1 outer membrane porin, OprD family [Pseudomonas helleri]
MNNLNRHALLPICTIACFSDAAKADFLKDSTAKLQMRNYYFQREYSDIRGAEKKQNEEWAQGFILDYNSGFTEGTFGFGIDILSLTGIKLDGGPGRSGSGLLPIGSDGDNQTEYSRAAATAKVKFGDTIAKFGEIRPNVPVLRATDNRLLPTTYQGFEITSKELPNSTISAAHLNSIKLRNQSGDGAFTPMLGATPYFNVEADSFSYAGGDFTLGRNTTLSAWHGELNDVFRQNYVGVASRFDVGRVTLKPTAGYYLSNDAGDAKVGDISSRAYYANITATDNGRSYILGYQAIRGNTGLPRVFINISQMGNETATYDFTTRGQTSYMIGYQYDFARIGVPGLTFGSKFTYGHDAVAKNTTDGQDRQYEADLAYVVQSGQLSGLGIRARYAHSRSDYRTDINEYRLLFTYDINLF